MTDFAKAALDSFAGNWTALGFINGGGGTTNALDVTKYKAVELLAVNSDITARSFSVTIGWTPDPSQPAITSTDTYEFRLQAGQMYRWRVPVQWVACVIALAAVSGGSTSQTVFIAGTDAPGFGASPDKAGDSILASFDGSVAAGATTFTDVDPFYGPAILFANGAAAGSRGTLQYEEPLNSGVWQEFARTDASAAADRSTPVLLPSKRIRVGVLNGGAAAQSMTAIVIGATLAQRAA